MTTQKTMVINYINQGQPNLALRELRPMEKANPQDVDIKNLMGLTYLSMQNSKTAQSFFQKAYKIEKRAPIALNLSSAMIENGQSPQAIKLLKDLQASEAGKAYQYPERIHHNLGLAAERIGKLSLAEKYYKIATEENPYFYISLMRLGAIYEQNKKAGFAYQQYLKAREACLKCFDPVNAAVQLQLRSGKAQLAVKTIQSYLDNKELDAADRMKAQQLMTSANRSVQQAKSSVRTKPQATAPR
ncbi:MAG: tetratricopeptide repeat protein [Bdellovibrionota bacterium]